MTRIFISSLLVLTSLQAYSDECFHDVEEYLQGVMKPVNKELYVSRDKVDWAYTEANRVLHLRKNMPDCEVIRHISLMTNADSSIEQNNLEIETLSKSSTNDTEKKTRTPTKHLYRY